MSDARTVLAENASLHAEVERLRAEADANWPCDGGCNVNDGPEETCSRHGRRVSEVWQMAHDAMQRAERAETAVEAVLALHVLDPACDDSFRWCADCLEPFPCPTVQALNDALLASEPSGSER